LATSAIAGTASIQLVVAISETTKAGSAQGYSSDLTFDGYSFARICGISDRRPLTATFTPHEPGGHQVLVTVYSYTAGYDPAIEGYVEFRTNVVGAHPR
jgi:hypothetical protein